MTEEVKQSLTLSDEPLPGQRRKLKWYWVAAALVLPVPLILGVTFHGGMIAILGASMAIVDVTSYYLAPGFKVVTRLMARTSVTSRIPPFLARWRKRRETKWWPLSPSLKLVLSALMLWLVIWFYLEVGFWHQNVFYLLFYWPFHQ